MYEYRGRALRVIDGDTIQAEVDLGIDVRVRLTLRLNGIDAPELATPEGKAARAYLIELLGPSAPGPDSEPLLIRTVKDRKEKYGRYLAELYVLDLAGNHGDASVNAQLVSLGFAKPYSGGKR